MIGGTDIMIPAIGNASAVEACGRVIQGHWPCARFEDAETGEKYNRYGDVPTAQVRELLVYHDAAAEAAWDADSADSPPNSMLYLIFSPQFITAVMDDPNTDEMQAILASLRQHLASPAPVSKP